MVVLEAAVAVPFCVGGLFFLDRVNINNTYVNDTQAWGRVRFSTSVAFLLWLWPYLLIVFLVFFGWMLWYLMCIFGFAVYFGANVMAMGLCCMFPVFWWCPCFVCPPPFHVPCCWGMQRVYVGRTQSGILYCLTCGVCCLGQLVDVFFLRQWVKDANNQVQQENIDVHYLDSVGLRVEQLAYQLTQLPYYGPYKGHPFYPGADAEDEAIIDPAAFEYGVFEGVALNKVFRAEYFALQPIALEETSESVAGDASTTPSSITIIVIPGCPGPVDYYLYYAVKQWELLRTRVRVIILAHSGHGVKELNGGKVFTLSDQVQQKCVILDHLSRKDPGTRFIIHAHSLGCRISMEVLRKRGDLPIDKVFFIFPFLRPVGGIRMQVYYWLSRRIPRELFALMFVGIYQLPKALQHYIFTSAGHKFAPHAVRVTLNLMTYSQVRNYLTMAASCIDRMAELDGDWDFDVIESNLERLYFYWNTTDPWSPMWQYHDLRRRIPGVHIDLDTYAAHPFVRSIDEVDVVATRVFFLMGAAIEATGVRPSEDNVPRHAPPFRNLKNRMAPALSTDSSGSNKGVRSDRPLTPSEDYPKLGSQSRLAGSRPLVDLNATKSRTSFNALRNLIPRSFSRGSSSGDRKPSVAPQPVGEGVSPEGSPIPMGPLPPLDELGAEHRRVPITPVTGSLHQPRVISTSTMENYEPTMPDVMVNIETGQEGTSNPAIFDAPPSLDIRASSAPTERAPRGVNPHERSPPVRSPRTPRGQVVSPRVDEDSARTRVASPRASKASLGAPALTQAPPAVAGSSPRAGASGVSPRVRAISPRADPSESTPVANIGSPEAAKLARPQYMADKADFAISSADAPKVGTGEPQ